MIDKELKDRLKKKAAELSDIFIENGTKGAEAYKGIYDSSEFNNIECFIIVRLCDLYIAIKQGITSKEDGVIQQRQILDTIELED